MDKTLAYYAENANRFVETTIDVDFAAVTEKYVSYLPSSALILDFGCGSGRDAKFFLEHGYRVEASDGSEEMCRRASEYTGIPVRHMLFQELNEKCKYDGIWACASVLHVPKAELSDVFSRMICALKDNGFIYMSFKYGTFEGERSGRYFCDFNEETFGEFISRYSEMKIIEQWISGDARPGREAEKWLNVILCKQ